MPSWVVLPVSLAYLALLFGIAWHGDRRRGRSTPALYALTLGVYCTSWTFYGSVGWAATGGFAFLSIYVGPILMLGLGWPLLGRILRLAKEQNAVSIADFIAARHGKSQAVAALVTVVAVVGVVPYVALQLKAVTEAFGAVTAVTAGGQGGASVSVLGDSGLYVALLMALFAILFGVRTVEASEHHRGLMRAIAFESAVKLAAFLAVGAAVTFWLSAGPAGLVGHLVATPGLAHLFAIDWGRPGFWASALLSAAAVLCLPRQFHVAVVENTDPAAVRTARWAFPAYLVAINLFVAPVAVAGLIAFGGDVGAADLFMVTVPRAAGAGGIALLAFIGGLSAATSMVIVETLALSTMVSNDVVVPILLGLSRGPRDHAGLARRLLPIRRAAVLLILGLAYGYGRLIGSSSPLAAIGIVSFAAVAQFAPAMLGGVIRRRGSRAGALAGIATGFALWLYTLLLPALAGAGWVAPDLLTDGPGGIGWLRPQALFGLGGLDPLSHAVLWSLGANAAAYILGSWLGSWLGRPGVVGRWPLRPAEPPAIDATLVVAELEALVAVFLGTEAAARLFRRQAASQGAPLRGRADLDWVRFTERQLAGTIGAASARVMVAGTLQRRRLSRADAVAMLDQASQVIRFNHGLLTATLETISQGISVFDESLRLRAWNRRFLELNNLPPDLVRVGTDLAEIVRFNAARGEYGAHGQIESMLARRQANPGHGEDLYERRRPDGTILEIATSPMPGGGFVATFTDVTERHRAAAALREANEGLERRVRERTEALAAASAAAERANQSKTRFLAAASHDLLQPLHAARLFTSALCERSDDPLAAKIEASLRSVETLLGALLDVSKLDAGATRVSREAFAIQPMLTALEEEFGAIAAERGLGLRIVASSAGVDSDPALLRRILQNFLSNAIRYTPRGRVLVGCRRRGDALAIEVWDTGIGIPADKRAEIFQEFHRLAAAGEEEKGLGLGLAIVDRIARMLGHPVAVRSIPGRGSGFAVTVPRAPVPAPAAERAPRGPRGLGGALVLCLDNEPVILDGMATLLGGWSCRVVAATGLAEAEARLGSDAPDLMVVDFHLGGGADGLEAVAALRRRFGVAVPAVLVTADHTDETRARIEAAGHAVLYKPLRPAALRALLARLVQLRPLPQDAG